MTLKFTNDHFSRRFYTGSHYSTWVKGEEQFNEDKDFLKCQDLLELVFSL